MDKFAQLLTLLLSEVKDPKIFLQRILTILLAFVLWVAVTHTSELLSYLQTFSSSAVLQDLKTQRINEFPGIAREKATMLFAQTRADAVFVTTYKPEAINDYQTIIAWEGNVSLDQSDMLPQPIDKTSELYRRQLDGFKYVYNGLTVPTEQYYGNNFPKFRNVQFGFVYTCPFFNLNNVYSGYIGIAWAKVPVQPANMEGFTDYLSKLCNPQIRALGRAL